MAVCDIARITKRVLELLVAMSVTSRYSSAAIGTNSEYGSLTEITDTILQIDAEICLDIISTPGHPYASLFMALSAAMSSGDEIGEHVGAYGDVHVAISGVYAPSIPAKSREEILDMIDDPTLYGGPSRFHYIESGFGYHSGDQGSASMKIFYPVFVKTAACQAHEAYESLEVYGTVATLEKDGGNAEFFNKYDRLYQFGRSLIRGKELLVPDQQKLERLLAKAT